MGDKTGIEWTDATWNPVTGCDRCSPGCDNCYALTMAARLKKMGSANYQNDGDPATSGPGFGVTCHPHMLDQPLRWKKPRRIFVNSMSDLFHPDVPEWFVERVFNVMQKCPQHTFQVLTKRPQRMAAMLTKWGSIIEQSQGTFSASRWPWPLPNVWLGVSIENDRYTFRADHLRATPATVRFISAEPLLGPLPSLDLTGIDWLIVGGESGPGARPMHPDWARDLRDRCCPLEHPCAGSCIGCGAGVDEPCVPPCACDDGEDCAASLAAERSRPKFLFKQWGEWSAPMLWDQGTVHERFEARKVGKRAAGRELDGRTWDEYPAVHHG